MFSLICALLCIFSFSNYETIAAPEDVVLTREVYAALDKVLDYMHFNHMYMNVDALFGLILAETHFIALLSQNLNQKDYMKVRDLEYKNRISAKLMKDRLLVTSSYASDFVKNITGLERWVHKVNFQSNAIDVNYTPGLNVTVLQDYINHMLSIQISEQMSDRCLTSILSTGEIDTPHYCTLSEECQQKMVDANIEETPGYYITHRLLLLQLIRSQNCLFDPTLFSQLSRRYCSYIYWEAKENAKYQFIDHYLDDLLMEQMTLCGYEGFSEFFDNVFIRHVIESQMESGCFSNPEFAGKRAKRKANALLDGCMDHTTGLGVSALTTVLRYLLTKEIDN